MKKKLKIDYRRKYKLGDEWECECGEVHELYDGYLAAHWTTDVLLHKCKCGRERDLFQGKFKLVKGPKEDA